MERGPYHKTGPGLLAAVSALAALSLVLTLGRTGLSAPAVQTSAAAAVELREGTAVPTGTAAVGKRVVPMGRAVGIKLFSDGVLVVGLANVDTRTGARSPGRDCGLKTGDLITHVDGDEVDTVEQIQQLLARRGEAPVVIQAMRGEKQVQLTAAPVRNSQGVCQLGVWLRDSMAGIGTMTFYDPDSGVFAALGHGINDVDTAMLMPLESGGIMAATVSDVKKGTSGHPGELHGQFDLEQDLGALYANTERGVFGRTSGLETGGMEPLAVAEPEEVCVGDAIIRSNVRGSQVEEFDVKITHVSKDGEGNRNLMIQVTDPDLLSLTGGIVQGMSGSPIIQNGKLVGAVTHVLVNDPTRGYGIFIENMLEAAS